MMTITDLLTQLVNVRRAQVGGVYADIARERLRAAKKHSDGSIELAPADDPRWWIVVMEEIGEVARAFQEEGPERVREELVQVAAMCAAWLDAAS